MCFEKDFFRLLSILYFIIFLRSDTTDLNRAFTGEACPSTDHSSGDSGRASGESFVGNLGLSTL